MFWYGPIWWYIKNLWDGYTISGGYPMEIITFFLLFPLLSLDNFLSLLNTKSLSCHLPIYVIYSLPLFNNNRSNNLYQFFSPFQISKPFLIRDSFPSFDSQQQRYQYIFFLLVFFLQQKKKRKMRRDRYTERNGSKTRCRLVTWRTSIQ